MKRFLLSIAAMALLSGPAFATPREVGGAALVGEARFSLLGLSLFDAALYTESGRFTWNDEFALSLTYKRNAREEVLLNRTIRGMSERGAGDAKTLAPLRARLGSCFSDVARGDRFTAVSTGPDTARFYLNGKESCTVQWPDFRRDFFGIWLDAKGGQAKLSAQLRGDT
jgi:hypothetical protein